MCLPWHNTYMLQMCFLACKVCAQELVHFLYESASNTPAHLSANKSPNLTGKRRCLRSGESWNFSGRVFMMEGVRWRRQLTRDPSQKPPGASLPYWSTPLPAPKPDTWRAAELVRRLWRPERWACSGGFVDGAVRTTHEMRLLSARWLTIHPNVAYFPTAPEKRTLGEP